MIKVIFTEQQLDRVMEQIAIHSGNEENIPKYTHEIAKILTDAKEYLKKCNSVVLNLSLEDILENQEKHISVFKSLQRATDSYRNKADAYYKIDNSLDERGIEYDKRQNFSDMVQETDRVADDIDTLKTIYEDLMDMALRNKNLFDYIKKTYPPDISNV